MVQLYNDNKSRADLLENIEICKCTFEDAWQILHVLKNGFNIKSEQEALRQLLYTNAQLNESVKVIDKRDGVIYGVLIFSLYPMSQGSPIFMDNIAIARHLQKYKQINGFAFIIDERLRGTDVHKRMLEYNKEYLDSFDFIWCAVDNDLKSHKYWERLGFTNVLNINEASFYILFNDKKKILEIFMIKMLLDKHANYY